MDGAELLCVQVRVGVFGCGWRAFDWTASDKVFRGNIFCCFAVKVFQKFY